MPVDRILAASNAGSSHTVDEILRLVKAADAEARKAAEPIVIDPAAALLDEAKRIVCGQRSQQYGSVEDNFGTIAAYWTAHLRGVGYDFTDPEQRLGATDVAILMMLMKCARLTADPQHKDSATDAAGYAACLARLQAKGEKPL